MTTYVPAALRRIVIERAEGLCEYCLIQEIDSALGFQIEHILSEKHGGPTTQENLAYACAFCNRAKGSDIASLSPRTGQLCRLFNPRSDQWSSHFVLADDQIFPISDIGATTVKLLQLNAPGRLVERQILRAIGAYPSERARKRMGI